MAAEGGAQRHGEKRAKEAEDEATVPASPEQMQQFALPLGLKPPEHVRKEETTNAGRPHPSGVSGVSAELGGKERGSAARAMHHWKDFAMRHAVTAVERAKPHARRGIDYAKDKFAEFKAHPTTVSFTRDASEMAAKAWPAYTESVRKMSTELLRLPNDQKASVAVTLFVCVLLPLRYIFSVSEAPYVLSYAFLHWALLHSLMHFTDLTPSLALSTSQLVFIPMFLQLFFGTGTEYIFLQYGQSWQYSEIGRPGQDMFVLLLWQRALLIGIFAVIVHAALHIAAARGDIEIGELSEAIAASTPQQQKQPRAEVLEEHKEEGGLTRESATQTVGGAEEQKQSRAMEKAGAEEQQKASAPLTSTGALPNATASLS